MNRKHDDQEQIISSWVTLTIFVVAWSKYAVLKLIKM